MEQKPLLIKITEAILYLRILTPVLAFILIAIDAAFNILNLSPELKELARVLTNLSIPLLIVAVLTIPQIIFLRKRNRKIFNLFLILDLLPGGFLSAGITFFITIPVYILTSIGAAYRWMKNKDQVATEEEDPFEDEFQL